MSNTDVYRTLAIIDRHDKLPMRDVLVALDQLRDSRKTLETINRNIERMMSDNMMCQKQAD